MRQRQESVGLVFIVSAAHFHKEEGRRQTKQTVYLGNVVYHVKVCPIPSPSSTTFLSPASTLY